MGLDMYLYAKRHLRDYVPEDKKIKNAIDDQLPAVFKDVQEIKVAITYWRKANAIHKWFVDNCQEGVDDCRETYVEFEKLKQLYHTCQTILENPDKAEELLPTASGFFFGSTEYDDGYTDDLLYTVNSLELLMQTHLIDVLKDEPSRWGFYYQSSW